MLAGGMHRMAPGLFTALLQQSAYELVQAAGFTPSLRTPQSNAWSHGPRHCSPHRFSLYPWKREKYGKTIEFSLYFRL